MWASVPHKDAARTRTRTSPGPHAGSGMSAHSSAPGLGAVLRIAFIRCPRPTRDAFVSGSRVCRAVWSADYSAPPRQGTTTGGETIAYHGTVASTVAFLASGVPLPEPLETRPDGLVAIGGDLSPERLLDAYRKGIFPWYHEEPILWF